MIADWTAEAGAESPHIVVPWEHWTDLRDLVPGAANQEAWIAERIPEARDYPELVPLLLAANSGDLFTAKVDVFPVLREEADPEIGEAGVEATAFGLGSYLDVVTLRLDVFTGFADYEQAARNTVRLLRESRQELCAAEIVLRPARLYDNDTFGWTVYALGFGSDESEARRRWAQALHATLAALHDSIHAVTRVTDASAGE